MSQGLTGGSRVGRSLAGGREVGEFVGGLLVLVLDVLSNGAWAEHMMSVIWQCIMTGWNGMATISAKSIRTIGNGIKSNLGI